MVKLKYVEFTGRMVMDNIPLPVVMTHLPKP